nr:pheromone 1 [Grifola frondosa]
MDTFITLAPPVLSDEIDTIRSVPTDSERGGGGNLFQCLIV